MQGVYWSLASAFCWWNDTATRLVWYGNGNLPSPVSSWGAFAMGCSVRSGTDVSGPALKYGASMAVRSDRTDGFGNHNRVMSSIPLRECPSGLFTHNTCIAPSFRAGETSVTCPFRRRKRRRYQVGERTSLKAARSIGTLTLPNLFYQNHKSARPRAAPVSRHQHSTDRAGGLQPCSGPALKYGASRVWRSDWTEVRLTEGRACFPASASHRPRGWASALSASTTCIAPCFSAGEKVNLRPTSSRALQYFTELNLYSNVN